MNRRLHNEYAVDASLHGIKIPMKHNPETSCFSEEEPLDAKIAEAAMKAAQARVRSRYV